MEAKGMFANLGSIIASLMFVWAMFQQYVPYQLQHNIEKYCQILVRFVYPYIQIRFDELSGDYDIFRSEAYTAIQSYLSSRSCTQANKLKADIAKNSQSLALRMDDHEEVADEFQGLKLWWASGKEVSNTPSWWTPEEKRYYRLTCHKRNRELILGPYLNHVIKEGKAIEARNRQRKLYTNSDSKWSHVVLKHPATFQTLAMDPEKKKKLWRTSSHSARRRSFMKELGGLGREVISFMALQEQASPP
jgi:chaperone BCS1